MIKKILTLKCFFIIIVLTILNCYLFAQVSGGGYAGSYLFKENGTRPISLAGAFTAVANDPSTIFYNPAGLTHCAPVPMISLSYSLLEYSRNFANLTYAQSFEKFGIGASLSSYKSGNIIARNRQGVEIGNYTDYFFNIAVGFSYSTTLASFGIVAKYLNNSLQGSGISGNGLSFDFGTKFNVLDLFNFGIAVQNVGGFVKYNTRGEKSNIPFAIRSGIATEIPLSEPKIITFRNEIGLLDTIEQPSPKYILLTLDATYIQYQKHPNLIFGTEISPHELFTIRGGITILGDKDQNLKFFPMTIWGGGVSFKPNFEDFYNLFSVDFSFGNDLLSRNKIYYSIGISLQF
ncbi:hypothetical protein D9V84_08390 [Bacteroidetes/Chlorobi group bacterium Naka2016]|jgi:hypothetical protein|nr:MAG: hypothetical protein D9V84_08390 [Bacteroidetes/Chlorobi group bacterium Naka2016]